MQDETPFLTLDILTGSGLCQDLQLKPTLSSKGESIVGTEKEGQPYNPTSKLFCGVSFSGTKLYSFPFLFNRVPPPKISSDPLLGLGP